MWNIYIYIYIIVCLVCVCIFIFLFLSGNFLTCIIILLLFIRWENKCEREGRKIKKERKKDEMCTRERVMLGLNIK